MSNKTLETLNEKVWYRFLKVIFVLAGLIVLGFYNLLIFSDGLTNVSETKTTIQCLHKDQKTFTAKQLNISFSNYDFPNGLFNYKNFYEGYNDYKIKAILKGCYDKEVNDVYSMQKYYELNLQDKTTISRVEFTPIQAMENTYLTSEKIKYLDYSFKFFDIKPQFTHSRFIWHLLIGNLIIIVVLEILRRVFYYVILGSIRPKKNEGNHIS